MKLHTMETQPQNTSPIAVLELSGRLDSHTVPEFRSQITANMSAQSPYLLLDLSDVTFVDSRALAVIVQTMHTCQGGGGELCISGPTNSVRRIFELTRLDKTIKIYSTQAEALASLEE